MPFFTLDFVALKHMFVFVYACERVCVRERENVKKIVSFGYEPENQSHNTS